MTKQNLKHGMIYYYCKCLYAILRYDANMNTCFSLTEKLAEYCENDVNILLYAMIELQKTFHSISARPGKHNGFYCVILYNM